MNKELKQVLIAALNGVAASANFSAEETDKAAINALLKEIGIEGEWEGIGHCAVGYVDGEFPKPANRKDNRVFWVE